MFNPKIKLQMRLGILVLNEYKLKIARKIIVKLIGASQ